MVISGAVFAKGEACDGYGRGPREKEAAAVGGVFDIVSPDVEDAGGEEEDCEGD